MSINLGRLAFELMQILHMQVILTQLYIHGSHTFSNTKFKDFSRTFQGLFIIFQELFREKRQLWSFYYPFYQISNHAYQWNYNIVENMKCRPKL